MTEIEIEVGRKIQEAKRIIFFAKSKLVWATNESLDKEEREQAARFTVLRFRVESIIDSFNEFEQTFNDFQ